MLIFPDTNDNNKRLNDIPKGFIALWAPQSTVMKPEGALHNLQLAIAGYGRISFASPIHQPLTSLILCGCCFCCWCLFELLTNFGFVELLDFYLLKEIDLDVNNLAR